MGRAAHLAPAGAAGHQAEVVGEEVAPALYAEEGCGGGGHEARAAAGEEEAAVMAERVPVDLLILL